MSKWFSALAFIASIIIPAVPVRAAVSDVVMFNEIRLGGAYIELEDETTIKEYVTLYNGGSETVLLDGWAIEYAKKPKETLSPQFCEATSWVGFEDVTVTKTSLSGELPVGAVSQPIELKLNDTGVGSLRLVHEKDEVVTVQDVVGWEDDAPALCKETAPTSIPAEDKSLFRYVDCDKNLPIDTNDNQKDFSVDQQSAPGQLGTVSPMPCEEEQPEVANCESVAVTEVLPNPASNDADNEFIEIHNSTDSEMSLHGCGLSVDGNEYWFAADEKLMAGEYKAFFDSTTGIGLTNSKSMDILVITKTEEFLQTAYPADLKDDISWALIENSWQQTDNSTPGAANKPMTPEEPTGKGAESDLDPCPVGKFRNPTTNRCKTIALVASALTPCKPGQTRNPATNRCRSTVVAASALTPCKPGQERNPATNRCRKVGSTDDELKPCDEDEERNPETNRCRKKQVTLASADIADKAADESKDMLNYGILGLVGFSALGYGAYEYRNDFRNKFLNLKSRFFSGKSGK